MTNEEMNKAFNKAFPLVVTVDDIMRKALDMADEIERLRKEVRTWIICAERLVESNEGEAYEKALAFYHDCQRIVNETCR